jgi:hypothetical protein
VSNRFNRFSSLPSGTAQFHTMRLFCPALRTRPLHALLLHVSFAQIWPVLAVQLRCRKIFWAYPPATFVAWLQKGRVQQTTYGRCWACGRRLRSRMASRTARSVHSKQVTYLLVADKTSARISGPIIFLRTSSSEVIRCYSFVHRGWALSISCMTERLKLSGCLHAARKFLTLSSNAFTSRTKSRFCP